MSSSDGSHQDRDRSQHPFRAGHAGLARHGITIALGIVIGAIAAARGLRHRDLPTDPMYTFGLLAGLGGIVGARIFYLGAR